MYIFNEYEAEVDECMMNEDRGSRRVVWLVKKGCVLHIIYPGRHVWPFLDFMFFQGSIGPIVIFTFCIPR